MVGVGGIGGGVPVQFGNSGEPDPKLRQDAADWALNMQKKYLDSINSNEEKIANYEKILAEAMTKEPPPTEDFINTYKRTINYYKQDIEYTKDLMKAELSDFIIKHPQIQSDKEIFTAMFDLFKEDDPGKWGPYLDKLLELQPP